MYDMTCSINNCNTFLYSTINRKSIKIIIGLYQLTRVLVHLVLNQTLALGSKATETFAIVWHPTENVLFIYIFI